MFCLYFIVLMFGFYSCTNITYLDSVGRVGGEDEEEEAAEAVSPGAET